MEVLRGASKIERELLMCDGCDQYDPSCDEACRGTDQ